MQMLYCRSRSALFAVCLFLGMNSPGAFALVKKSSSGICHPPESSHYTRTTAFTGFESVQACLASGGRLPKGMKLKKPEADTGYQRDKFGHGWDDADGDCQNSRAEALIASSTGNVRFSDNRRCRVTAGRWISPFTGEVIQNASQIDIDHVVPLKWAWQHGASDWNQGKREAFANDMNNLWSVELSLNRQKGAKGPEEWLPPAGQCQYVSRFVRLIKVYKLQPTSAQTQQYRKLLARHC